MVKTAKIGKMLLTTSDRSIERQTTATPLPSMRAERYKSSVKHCVGVVSCPSTLTHRRFTEIA
ncbi:hypothetical protein T03_5073 [Trichinella britovi]|uniref:Uncharacterized protein n=2 Tax=Trichinella TaxID=6333 RepID=A0A0V1CMK5_TRIBR|nr:hypothetical protein T05_13681 [Trichinella murrelli]KRY50302.1 hypothetical protein T03_5073 [Trichinella britovi]KRZ85433.1 hypothetical protein T08_284 [Trichinella sp. T8]